MSGDFILTQEPKTDNQDVLQQWLEQTDHALAALHDWRAYLQAWQLHPGVSMGAFYQATHDLAENNLLGWLYCNEASFNLLLKEVVSNDYK